MGSHVSPLKVEGTGPRYSLSWTILTKVLQLHCSEPFSETFMADSIASDQLNLCFLSHLGFMASSSRSVCEGPWWGFPSRLDMSVNRRLCLFTFAISSPNHLHDQNLKYLNPMKIFPGFHRKCFCRGDLSFQKVQHLYNPWNEGKPVKIGRDGQVL